MDVNQPKTALSAVNDGIVRLDPTLTYTENGIPFFKEDATEDELISSVASAIGRINDLLFEIAAAAYRWKEQGRDIKDFTQQTQLSPRRVEELELTYRRAVKKDLKLGPSLNFKHLTVSTREENSQEWLNKAEDNGWSANQTAVEIHMAPDKQEREAALVAAEPCPECSGSGRCSHCHSKGSCPECAGSGRRPVANEVEVIDGDTVDLATGEILAGTGS